MSLLRSRNPFVADWIQDKKIILQPRYDTTLVGRTVWYARYYADMDQGRVVINLDATMKDGEAVERILGLTTTSNFHNNYASSSYAEYLSSRVGKAIEVGSKDMSNVIEEYQKNMIRSVANVTVEGAEVMKMVYMSTNIGVQYAEFAVRLADGDVNKFDALLLLPLLGPIREARTAKGAIVEDSVTVINKEGTIARRISVRDIEAARFKDTASKYRSYLSSKASGLNHDWRTDFLKGDRNIGVGELEVGGKTYEVPAFSGTVDVKGFAPYIENSERKLQVGGHGKFIRDVDAEAKILERIMEMTDSDVSGTLKVYSELAVCPSCRDAFDNFAKYRPYLRIQVYDGANGFFEIMPKPKPR